MTFGPYLKIHKDFKSHIERTLKFSKIMEEDPSWQLKQKTYQESQPMMFGKSLVRDTQSFYKKVLVLKVQMENNYVVDMKNKQEIFKRKLKVLQLFNYDPFIEQVHLVLGVLKRNGGMHDFYKYDKPPKNPEPYLLALVEVIHESEIANMMTYLKESEIV